MMKCHKQDAMKLIHLTLKYKRNLGTSPIVSASLKTTHTKIEVGLSKSISFAFFSLKYRWLQAVYSRELIDTRNFGSHWVVHWAGPGWAEHGRAANEVHTRACFMRTSRRSFDSGRAAAGTLTRPGPALIPSLNSDICLIWQDRSDSQFSL